MTRYVLLKYFCSCSQIIIDLQITFSNFYKKNTICLKSRAVVKYKRFENVWRNLNIAAVKCFYYDSRHEQRSKLVLVGVKEFDRKR
jgi:hypothetical protein